MRTSIQRQRGSNVPLFASEFTFGLRLDCSTRDLIVAFAALVGGQYLTRFWVFFAYVRPDGETHSTNTTAPKRTIGEGGSGGAGTELLFDRTCHGTALGTVDDHYARRGDITDAFVCVDIAFFVFSFLPARGGREDRAETKVLVSAQAVPLWSARRLLRHVSVCTRPGSDLKPRGNDLELVVRGARHVSTRPAPGPSPAGTAWL